MSSHQTWRSIGPADGNRPEILVFGRQFTALALIGIFSLLAVACAATGPGSAPPSVPTASPGIESPEPAGNSVTAAMPAASTAAAATPPDSDRPKTVKIAEGSVARYLVREQLANLDFPIDAMGQTAQVSGSIVFDSNGQVVSESSRIVVDLASLTSDEDRRDNFLRTRSLESRDFPSAAFVVRQTPGLAWPLPSEGEASFQLVGDMTLHGITRPQTWEATAQFNDGGFTSQARTNFPFEYFNLEVPRVRILLSVENDIRLELELTGSVS